MNLKDIRTRMGIYLITNLINGKCYIGQSVDLDHRLRVHKRASTKQAIHAAIRKYGVENFSFEILLECPVEALDFFERAFIVGYESYGEKGYNLNTGGDGNRGWQVSTTTKEKLRKAALGKKQSPEVIAKRMAGQTGSKRSEETKRKMSEAAKAAHLRKKQSEINKETKP